MKMMSIHTMLLTLVLSACTKGKDCEQLYQDFINVENRTGRALVLEFVDEPKEPYTIELAPFEKAHRKLLREYYLTHEGGIQKGGGAYDATCTSEPIAFGTGGFLAESSFNKVKHCWDNENNASILVELSESCPSKTFEQKKPGRPPW